MQDIAYNIRPEFHIMICLVEIWHPTDKSQPTVVPTNGVTRIVEVEKIQISETWKQLIGSANVYFPRGSVIRQTIRPVEGDTTLTNEGEWDLTTKLDSTGAILEANGGTTILNSTTFQIDDRIRIYLGYTTDPAITNLAKLRTNSRQMFNIWNDTKSLKMYKAAMTMMFDGYIRKISADQPIELECESLACVLDQITCDPKEINNATAATFLGSGEGCLNLLKDTGITIHPNTNLSKFTLGKQTIGDSQTIADVIAGWKKRGVYATLINDTGTPKLKLFRGNFKEIPASSSTKHEYVLYLRSDLATPQIDFDYHVANNGLHVVMGDPKYMAVEAQGVEKSGEDEKQIHFALLKNPSYDENNPEGESRYLVKNESKLSKKSQKLGLRTLSSNPKDNKIDLKRYTRLQYTASKTPITRDELYQEAIDYLENYNVNGIEGSLTLFGDLTIRTGQQVLLNDNRLRNKNGYYIVEEVNTTFSAKGGYRQELKLPYCVKSLANTSLPDASY